MKHLLVILALALAALLYVVAPAHAETDAELALAALCPRHVDLAPMVQDAAHAQRLGAVELVAVMAAESGCRTGAVNRRTGAVGLLQILPEGSANVDHLSAGELADPATNLDLGAGHLSRLLALCGSLGGALTLYNGYSPKCRDWRTDPYARHVRELVAKAWRFIARRRAAVS